MSVKYFNNDHSLYMFDPETFQIHLYQHGTWVATDDSTLREDIRFRSVELSHGQALELSRT